MNTVDSVIARSRAPGGFSERKRFTIARKQAILKLRKFALADPYYYILELIQAAIANGALHLDIQIEDGDCTLAYIGGGLHKSDLAQLFDYLFASKDRAEVSHLRELAIGINAALGFAPSRVIVESGDGTLAGTSRLLLHGKDDAVEIGTPTQPLAGTFVRFEGMNRGGLAGFQRFFSSGPAPPREISIIETRCLAAPIPILVNGTPLFGFSAQRTPNLYGYQKVVSFDEGDLYGSIGLAGPDGAPDFNLLMWGVSITRRTHTFIPSLKIGGVVCFDRLRKTADHSGVVDDDRLAELWLRLGRHVNRLVGTAQQQDFYLVRTLEGDPLAHAELRAKLEDVNMLVLAPESTTEDQVMRDRARRIGAALDAPVLAGELSAIPALRASAGGTLRVVVPGCRDDDDLNFYRQPLSTPPARPWLAHAVDVDPLPLRTLVARLLGTAEDAEPSEASRSLAAIIGTGESVRASVYSPEVFQGARSSLTVDVRSSGRHVVAHALPSVLAGCVLTVELPEAQVARLVGKRLAEQTPLTLAIARAMSAHAGPALAVAFSRASRRLADETIEPGTPLARFGLLAIARSATPRLCVRNGQASVHLSQLDKNPVDLLGLPLLRTLGGAPRSLREVADSIGECGGLFYGTRRDLGADIAGLDPERILEVDAEEEQLLLALFGESAYVRVDSRDVLAEAQGVVCRDLALGLREYPPFPLLTEGRDVGELDPASRETCLASLTAQLVTLINTPPDPTDLGAFAAHEENRRHAARQLQWLVCGSAATPDGLRRNPTLGALPLFRSPGDEPVAFNDLLAALQSPSGLRLHYAHGRGTAELGRIAEAIAAGQTAPRQQCAEVVASPFVHALLRSVGTTYPSFDFALPDASTIDSDDIVASVDVDEVGVTGRVAIASKPVAHPDIVVLLADRSRARSLSELAIEHGCVGWVRLDEAVEWTDERVDAIARAVKFAAEGALAQLLARLRAQPESPDRVRWTNALLGYAGRQLSLVVPPLAPARVIVRSDLAQSILELPLFDSREGDPTPALTLIRRFCGLVRSAPGEAAKRVRQTLAPNLASHLDAWLANVLDAANLVPQHADAPRSTNPPTPPVLLGPVDSAHMITTLRYWLPVLNPAGAPEPTAVWLTLGDHAELVKYTSMELFVEETHWLCQAVIHNGVHDPSHLAWLLLGIYAKLNAVFDDVTNLHERQFQQRVTQALTDGRLRMLRSVGPAPPTYATVFA